MSAGTLTLGDLFGPNPASTAAWPAWATAITERHPVTDRIQAPADAGQTAQPGLLIYREDWPTMPRHIVPQPAASAAQPTPGRAPDDTVVLAAAKPTVQNRRRQPFRHRRPRCLTLRRPAAWTNRAWASVFVATAAAAGYVVYNLPDLMEALFTA